MECDKSHDSVKLLGRQRGRPFVSFAFLGEVAIPNGVTEIDESAIKSPNPIKHRA